MRPSESAGTLPTLDGSRKAAQVRQAYGGGRGKAPASRLEVSSSAPSLSASAALTLTASVQEMREGVERVVARLTERPGMGRLLLLQEQEHGAHMLRAMTADQRPRRGPPPPRLLTQPPIKLGMLNALGRRSTVLSDIAD